MNRNKNEVNDGTVHVNVLVQIAQILVLRLPEETEQIIGNKWIKKFLMTDDKEKCEKYLYLFILSTKQQMLVEPFNDPPKSMNSKWDDFDKEYTLQDIKNSVLKQNGLDLITPQYKIDISRDLMEYVAYQEIPNFGCHFYYAFSLQQLPNWQKFSKFKVPKKLISTLFTTNFPIPPQDDDDDDDDDDNDEEETTTPEPSEIPELETPESVEAVPGSITTSHVRFSAKRPKRLEGRARGLALLEDALKKIKSLNKTSASDSTPATIITAVASIQEISSLTENQETDDNDYDDGDYDDYDDYDDQILEDRVNEKMKKISEASQSPHDSARHNDLKAKLASIKAVELQPIVIAEVLIEPSEIEEIESFQLPPEFLDASDRIRSVARMTTVEIERLNRNETPNLITTDIITAATDQVGHQFLDALQSTDTINNHNAAMSVVEILDATIANRNLVQMVASPFRVVDLDTTLRLKEIKEQMEAEHQRVNEWLENDNLFSVSNSSIIEEKKPFQIVEFDFDSVDESVGMRTSSRWMKMRIAEKIEIVDEMNIQLESLSDDILGNIQEAIVNCEIADQELQKLDQEVEVTPLIQNNAETADALMLVAIDINLIISDNRPSLPEEVAEASNEAVMILRNSFKKTLNLSDALVTSDETKQIEEKKIEQFELIAQDISNSIDVMDNSIPSACARAEIMDISHATADKSLERKLMNRSKRILEQVNEALDLCRQEQSSLESSYHEDGSIQYFSILSDNNSAAIDNLEEVQNILFNDLSDPETDPEP